MKPAVTPGIVLARVNYQEADRILTILTPEQGKLRLMAKGARKEKSKLAGGVELFSISELSFIKGRGEVGTLVSSRLGMHFGNIVKDINRTMYGYDLLKLINKITEDNAEAEYYTLLQKSLEALNDETVPLELVQLWVNVRLLQATGHTLNTVSDSAGSKLSETSSYHFDSETMAFVQHPDGQYASGHIKLLRLCQTAGPAQIATVGGVEPFVAQANQLATSIRKTTLHV